VLSNGSAIKPTCCVCGRDGRHLSDDEVSGLLIALLFSSQHTTTRTTAWLMFFLAQNKEIQVLHELYKLSERYAQVHLITIFYVHFISA
jgi:cytochrome P450